MKSYQTVLANALILALASSTVFANDDVVFNDESISRDVQVAQDVQLNDADAGALGQAKFESIAMTESDLVSLKPLGKSEQNNLLQSRLQSKNPGVALAIGVARDFPPTSMRAAQNPIVATADGGRAQRFSALSSGAKALRLGYHYSGPSKGVTLRFGNDLGQVFEVPVRDIAQNEINWSPVVAGERMHVEVSSDAGVDLSRANVELVQISHLDIDPALPADAFAEQVAAKIGESDSCQRDVVCRTSPPSGFRTTADAVARMVYTSGGRSFLCTGTLLNNNNATRRHLFWSANHCISSQTVANTLQTYWFYEATTCGGSTVSSRARTLSGGAFLRHNNASRDTLLLELKSAPPAGAIYAGWTSGAITSTGTAIEGIHHPSGDVKMYSLGSVNSTNGNIDGLGPFYRVTWSTGVTEGGSSGSGLFTRNSSGAYQLRGGLYGGLSFCTAPTDPDYYSKLSDVWTSVKPFLSP